MYNVGLGVGRLPIGYYFIDIFMMGLMLAAGLVLAGVTYWLLCKRVRV